MTSDMNKFFEFDSYDGVVRFVNNAPCPIKWKGYIIVDGKTNSEDVYLVNGLKHNLLSVGQLVDNEYLL